ncbi:MAG: chemotaxis protein CheW [Methylomonas sp.]|jgi:purine-binding chemotaxis protein CheW
MDQTKPQTRIIQQGLALNSYLRTLLDEIPDADEAAADPEPPAEIEIITPPPKVLISPIPAVKKPPPAKLVLPENPATLNVLAVMPEWAQHEFQALFFKVDKLILATPLIELARTIKNERKPTKIPGQPTWFMGLLEVHGNRIGILDTGQLIFGKIRGAQRNLEQKPYKHFLITQDQKWGLACDEILSIGKLSPENVRWRTNRQKKKWLIGTVVEELTAIIDVKQLTPHRKQS